MGETRQPFDPNYPRGHLFSEDKDWKDIQPDEPLAETDKPQSVDHSNDIPLPGLEPDSPDVPGESISIPRYSEDDEKSKPLTEDQIAKLSDKDRKLYDSIGWPGTDQYDQYQRRRFL
ncbi:MAG: hypothetical protein WC080_03995 [Patescibacteria group bacterium]|jgi:hypothetical protein